MLHSESSLTSILCWCCCLSSRAAAVECSSTGQPLVLHHHITHPGCIYCGVIMAAFTCCVNTPSFSFSDYLDTSAVPWFRLMWGKLEHYSVSLCWICLIPHYLNNLNFQVPFYLLSHKPARYTFVIGSSHCLVKWPVHILWFLGKKMSQRPCTLPRLPRVSRCPQILMGRNSTSSVTLWEWPWRPSILASVCCVLLAYTR